MQLYGPPSGSTISTHEMRAQAAEISAVDALAEEEQEIEARLESLKKNSTEYKMEISAEKTKLIKK